MLSHVLETGAMKDTIEVPVSVDLSIGKRARMQANGSITAPQ